MNASLAQRIVRKICEKCKQQFVPEKSVQENIKAVLGDFLPKQYKEKGEIILFKGKGCEECDNSGYFGRIGIFELLKVSPIINKLILQEANAKDIQTQAIKEGLITIKQDGYLKVLAGITSLEEVLRVAEM